MGAVGALWSFSPIKLGRRGLAWGSGVTEGLAVVPARARAVPVFSHFPSVLRKEICQHSWKKAGVHCWCPLEPSLEAFVGKPEGCSGEVCWAQQLLHVGPLSLHPQFWGGHPSIPEQLRVGSPDWEMSVVQGFLVLRVVMPERGVSPPVPQTLCQPGCQVPTRAAALPVSNTFLGRSQLAPTLLPDCHLLHLHPCCTCL